MSEDHGPGGFRRFQPSERAVADLIGRAERRSGGTDFLVNGAHDAVAATFGVHAFVVDAARARLQDNGTSPPRTDVFQPPGDGGTP